MTPTIKDVAKKAKVSTATVSRILNDLPGYKPETKETVLKAIAELGYQPNAVARGLINKKTNTIGVLFPDVSSMFSSEVLNGVEDKAKEFGHSVIVCNTASNGQRTLEYLQVLQEKRVDGVIFTSESIKEEYYKAIEAMQIPVILLSTASYRYSLPYVKVDDRHAAYSATEYLVKQGHKQIAMISGPKRDPIAGVPRVEGFNSALADYELFDRMDHVIESKGFSYQDGKDALKHLVKEFPETTAVFVASDEMAVGALSSAYALGIHVPKDLSIIGYDNLKISEMSIPPLTTIAQPLYKMGMTASSMLLEMIETGQPVENRIMNHSVLERESVQQL